MQDSIRDKYKFFILFYLFVLIGVPVRLFLKIFDITLSAKVNVYLELALELVMFVVVILLYKEDFKKAFKNLEKKNLIENIFIMIGIFFGAYVVQILSGLIVIVLIKLMGLTLSESANNEAVKELLRSAPVLMGIDAVLIAPFIEESMFRMGLHKAMKNKKVFIAVSGIIFGIMHVIDREIIILTLPIVGLLIDLLLTSKNKKKILLSITCLVSYILLIICFMSFINGGFMSFIKTIDIKEAIFAIEYVCMGMYLSFVYYKFNNVIYNIVPHAMINLNASMLLKIL